MTLAPLAFADESQSVRGADAPLTRGAPFNATSERRLAPMSFFPGIVSAKFYATWEFYTELLGFRTMAEWDTYVELAHPSGARLAILKEETDEQLAELVSRSDGRGLWWNLEVADVDATFARLRAAGVPVAVPPVTKPWGCRQCWVRDPNGILLCLQRPAA